MRSRTARDKGFSLVEVIIAVAILGVTGLAFIDGLQSNVLQVRRVDANASTAIALASAVENIKAAPYISCAISSTPYNALPNGLSLPAGISLAIQEFVPLATSPWQECQQVRTAGSSQFIVLSATDGSTRTMMRFAPGTPTATPSPTSSPVSSTPLAAAVTTDPRSSCSTFSKSSASKPCLITIANSAGSGTTWRITGITFAGGDFLNPAPTVAIPQSSLISFNTYTLDGGRLCPDKKSPVMAISLIDDGNGTTTTVYPVITC